MSTKFANQLDWNLLRTFMVIVQERSITQAAHRLNVTQPSISAALRRLEERLARRLLERGGAHSFKVTEAGEVLYRHCVEVYGSIAAVPNEIDATAAQVSGLITLEIAPWLYWPALGSVMLSLQRKYPLLRLRWRRNHAPAILEALAHKQLSIGIVSSSNDARPVLRKQALERLAMGYFHHVSVQPRDLCTLGFIAYESAQGDPALDAMQSHRFAAGLQGPLVAEAADCDGVRELIDWGLGVGLLPLAYARQFSSLVALEVDVAMPVAMHSLPMLAVRHERAHLGRAERCFFEHLRDCGVCTGAWA